MPSISDRTVGDTTLRSLGLGDGLPVGVHRYQPRTYDQMLSTVFALWNLLDANINQAQLAGHGYVTRFGTPY